MGWLYTEVSHKFRDKKGWDSAKGLLAKIRVGKTGITEKMVEINTAWKTIDGSKLGIYHVSKNPAADKKAALAEMEKMEKLKPKIKEIKTLAETTTSTYGAKLPADAKKFLNSLIAECTSYPTAIDTKKKSEVEEWKKNHKI